MNYPKRIAILGSTGSIGCQALEIVREHPEKFKVTVLTAMKSAHKLIEQAIEFNPSAVVVGDETAYPLVKDILVKKGIEVFCGLSEVAHIVTTDMMDVVLNAIVGYAGFEPTISALKAGKPLALANKESLVVGGELVTSIASDTNTTILPVDSEHSAVFQCLLGESPESIGKIILTASGGPFLNYTNEQLQSVTKKDALNHPNWEMGSKITIDSATMMNKGLEVIEARWLFNCKPEDIEVVIHPQSIVHSLVEFRDGSIKAQLGLPDMRLPIIYALSYPDRLENSIPKLDFYKLQDLTFLKPDMENFRNLALAFEALKSGGNAPCVLNAANEVAVEAFLSDQISFLSIPEIVESCLEKINHIGKPVFTDYVETDHETRRVAKQIIEEREN